MLEPQCSGDMRASHEEDGAIWDGLLRVFKRSGAADGVDAWREAGGVRLCRQRGYVGVCRNRDS